jgi:hypothetical protein
MEIRDRPPGSAIAGLLRPQGQDSIPHRLRRTFRHARSLSWRTEKNDTKVSITISNGKAQMDFAGVIDADYEYGPPRATNFDQPDLGYARDDPELYQDKWHALEDRLFDLLDFGQPLTISAEGKSYVLAPVDAPGWRTRFRKIC